MESGLINIQETKKRLMEILELTEYEARAYIHLLRSKSPTVSELSFLSGIPRPKCYHAIKGLVAKNMVALIPSKPLRCKAIDPKEALLHRISEFRKDLDKKVEESEQLANQLKRVMEEGVSVDSQGRPDVVLVDNEGGIFSTLESDMATVNEEILVAISNMPVKFDWRSHIKKMEITLSRGVKIKYLVPSLENFVEKAIGAGYSPLHSKVRKWVTEGKFNVRQSKANQQPFSVFDERVVHLYFTDPVNDRLLCMLRIQDKRFAEHMRRYFNIIWDSAKEGL